MDRNMTKTGMMKMMIMMMSRRECIRDMMMRDTKVQVR